jgi:hypothetical protein
MVLAPSTVKILNASAFPLPQTQTQQQHHLDQPPVGLSDAAASVWADMTMMSARGSARGGSASSLTGAGDLHPLLSARSSAASTALIASLGNLSTYIGALEQATAQLQTVRANVARVNAQSLIENERQRRVYEEAAIGEQERSERQHNRALAVVMMERERALRLHEFAATQEEEWEMRHGAQMSAVAVMEAERQRQVQALRDRMRAERERRQRVKDQQRKTALELERQRHAGMRTSAQTTAPASANNLSLTVPLSPEFGVFGGGAFGAGGTYDRRGFGCDAQVRHRVSDSQEAK